MIEELVEVPKKVARMTVPRFVDLARRFWDKVIEDQIPVHASSLAYTSVLSLIPLIALGYFAFSLLGGFESLVIWMRSFVSDNFFPHFGDRIIGSIDSIQKKISPGALGVFGFAGFVFTGITTFAKIESTLNHIWKLKTSRPWMRKVTTYWSMLTLGPLVFGISFTISGKAFQWLKEDNGDIAKALVFLAGLVPYCLSSLFFSFIYYLLPNALVGRRASFAAGALTGLFFEVSKQLYAFYVSRQIGNSVYGSLAVLPLFLVWLYWVWFVVLMGAELCFYLDQRWSDREKDQAREKHV